MFTGIIEATGIIGEITEKGTNRSFRIRSSLSTALKADQSLAHDGVCLTVEEVFQDAYRVTAVEETLKKTNLGGWRTGDAVNLERSMVLGGRLDGHLVQGHVDATATCISTEPRDGSWLLTFRFPEKFAALVIEKGSVCVNGVSLTAFNVTGNSFTVAIIPYTWDHTNLSRLKAGDMVNIEFDMMGKYIIRFRELESAVPDEKFSIK